MSTTSQCRSNQQLSRIFQDPARPELQRSLATDILADFVADNPSELADLLMAADHQQFAVIFPKFKEQALQGLPLLQGEIGKTAPEDAPASAPLRERLAKRQANAAVALFRMNQPERAWPLPKHSPDPRARTCLIHRLSQLGADPGVIIRHLEYEPDVTIQRALLLSLGEYGERELTAAARKSFLPKLQELYRDHSDPGLHAAAQWLLTT